MKQSSTRANAKEYKVIVKKVTVKDSNLEEQLTYNQQPKHQLFHPPLAVPTVEDLDNIDLIPVPRHVSAPRTALFIMLPWSLEISPKTPLTLLLSKLAVPPPGAPVEKSLVSLSPVIILMDIQRGASLSRLKNN
jgi:hypothetical protein